MIMIDNNIRVEKLQYDFNSKAAKIAVSTGKIDEFSNGKEILPFNQSQMINLHIHLCEKVKKQTKTIKGQEENKQKICNLNTLNSN